MTSPWFESPHGAIIHGESLGWLAGLPDASAQLVVADPPYNVKKAEWDTFASREAYVAWSRRWLEQVARVLTPTGTAYVMGYSEVLADLKWASSDLFEGCRWLVWTYRNRGNLQGDWGRAHESILHLRRSRSFTMNIDAVRVPYNAHTRRYPQRDQGASSHFGKGGAGWRPHPLGAKPRDVFDVPILNNAMAERTKHPTQKPEELIRRFVEASSDPGDTVLDPFLGSGTTGVVCEMLGRAWAGCEQDEAYCSMARERVEAVLRGERSIEIVRAEQEAMRANRRLVRG